MLTQYIALVSQTADVKMNDVVTVAAALQKQVQRDFRDAWDIDAVVSAFPSVEQVPCGYWPILVVDQIEGGQPGLHHDENNQPIALVAAARDWSLIASHECLEMLVDPWGSRVIAGNSIKGPLRRVEYLVEVCDPVQHRSFGYPVNGVLVSDFYTQNYFDPVASAGTRYSFNSDKSRMSGPREVLEKGYLTWRDPVNDRWYQASRTYGELDVTPLGKKPVNAMSLRTWVDSQTKDKSPALEDPDEARALDVRLDKIRTAHSAASRSNAKLWAGIGMPVADNAQARPGAGVAAAIADDPLLDSVSCQAEDE